MILDLIGFILSTDYHHIDFNHVGIALLSISLAFPVFDKFTEKTADEFEKIKNETLAEIKENKHGKNPQVVKSELDIQETRLNKKLNSLRGKSTLSKFKMAAMCSVGFLIVSALNNTFKYNFLNFFLAGDLIFLLLFVSYKIRKLANDRKESRAIIETYYESKDDPIKALLKVE